jgi:guanylate kinase
MEGKLVIISAPSGAGKTTIVKFLLDSGLGLEFSVSATTRPIRGDEKNGKDYFFLTVQEFRKKIEENEFIEWEEVYRDLFYGTLKSEIDRIWKNGHHVLFDVDVKGGINLKSIFGKRSVAIFIMPPSVEELENRLIRRGTETREKVLMRISKAREELRQAENFDHIIVNEELDKANEETLKIVASFISG